MIVLLMSAAVLGGAAALARWLRTSQREHYHPWQATTAARRWTTRRPPNAALVATWVLLAGCSVATSGWISSVAALTGLAVGAVFPVGMPLLGRPRLRLTRRAIYQGSWAAALAASTAAALGLFLGLRGATALLPGVVLIAVDCAAVLNLPIERRIARGFRRQAEDKLTKVNPRVVAITGSYGKTTVKNHVRDLLSPSMTVLATPASWNNEAGLSRAINEQLTPGIEVFVAEMGTYGPGELEALVSWVHPEVAVITAIGPVHLERMGTLENIVRVKSEIVDGARSAVICIDYPLLAALADDLERTNRVKELWRVGTADHADVSVSPDASGDQFSVTVRGSEIAMLDQTGVHPSNVACAVAAACALGVDTSMVARALKKLQPVDSRATVAATEDGVVVVDDTFNSNPDGAEAALRRLCCAVAGGRRVVVTPGMVELGPAQFKANERFARSVAESGCELVIVGWTNRAALRRGHSGAIVVPNRDRARQWVRVHLRPGDGVLWENDLPDHYP